MSLTIAQMRLSPNMPGFLKALTDTPKVQLRYMRGEMSRGVKRTGRVSFKSNYMDES